MVMMLQVEEQRTSSALASVAGFECLVGLFAAAVFLWVARRRRIAERSELGDSKMEPHDPEGDLHNDFTTDSVGVFDEDVTGNDSRPPQAENTDDANISVEDESSEWTPWESEKQEQDEQPPPTSSELTESMIGMAEFTLLDTPREPTPTDTDWNESGTIEVRSPSEQSEDDAGESDMGNILQREATGARTDFWSKCENKEQCRWCGVTFSLVVRRHHCRKCYASVCSSCSTHNAALSEFGGSIERICDRCYEKTWEKQEETSAL